MSLINLGVQLMLYGLAGVFVTLLLFFLMVKGLVAVSKRRR